MIIYELKKLLLTPDLIIEKKLGNTGTIRY
jgi:hypothetical protein